MIDSEQEIRHILAQLSSSTANLMNAEEEVDLRNYGMNSLLFIQFVVAIEEKFSIEVSAEFLDIDILNCISKWKEYIMSQETVC